MTEIPSAGWREVYRWCSVPLPMTPRTAATVGEAESGTRTQHKLSMSQRQNQSEQKEAERYAKRKCREIARDLESAQGCATLPQLVDEIRMAAAELVHVRSEIEEEVEA